MVTGIIIIATTIWNGLIIINNKFVFEVQTCYKDILPYIANYTFLPQMFAVIRQYSYSLQDDFADIEAIITQLPVLVPVMFRGLRPVWASLLSHYTTAPENKKSQCRAWSTFD